jgi:PKHD-type hydroxylase
MNLKYYYWYFQNALSTKFCEEVIKHGKSKQEELALTGGQTIKVDNGKSLEEQDLKDLKKQRDSNVVWLSEQWIYKEIQPYIHQANKNAGWNFDWDYSESCQFTKYKLNQFYDWHCDSWDEPYEENHKNKNFSNKIRKLSVTCSLSDPNDYEGGELEFDFKSSPNNKEGVRKCAEISPRGSIVVFPSFVWHRVKPVTKGTRYSLVIWSLGYPFR